MPNAMERPDRGEQMTLPVSVRRFGKLMVVSQSRAVKPATKASWTGVAAPKMFELKRRTGLFSENIGMEMI
jgi:hypothetical protein